MPPAVVVTSDNRRLDVGSGFETDFIDFSGVDSPPSAGYTKTRVYSKTGQGHHIVLPPGETLYVTDSNGNAIFYAAAAGVQVLGARSLQGVNTLQPNANYTHLNGGLYVGGTNSPLALGAQDCGLHYGLYDGCVDGNGGSMLYHTTNTTVNTTYKDHPYLQNAETKTGRVELTGPAGQWAEFLIQGGGTGSGTCTITLLRDYSSGLFGVSGAGTTYELRFNSGHVRLYCSTGTYTKVTIRPIISYIP